MQHLRFLRLYNKIKLKNQAKCALYCESFNMKKCPWNGFLPFKNGKR